MPPELRRFQFIKVSESIGVVVKSASKGIRNLVSNEGFY